jgi:cell division septal protein FtsQ
MNWNRRRKRGKYLLDVQVETDARAQAQRRWLGAVLVALALVGVTGYGIYRVCRFAANRLVYENPRFTITQITVATDGALTPAQIQRFAGLQTGLNLFAVSLDQVRRNLELVPQIQRVEVRRLLPQRLDVRVSERIAVARLQAANPELRGTIFFVDRAGVVMKPLRLTDGTTVQPATTGPVPLLTGAPLADVRIGQPAESEPVRAALALLNQLQQTAAGIVLEVEQMDVSRPRHITVLTRQRTRVRFDVQDFQPQLRRLNVILNWAQQRQKLPAAVDLTVARGVPVTFAN